MNGNGRKLSWQQVVLALGVLCAATVLYILVPDSREIAAVLLGAAAAGGTSAVAKRG